MFYEEFKKNIFKVYLTNEFLNLQLNSRVIKNRAIELIQKEKLCFLVVYIYTTHPNSFRDSYMSHNVYKN